MLKKQMLLMSLLVCSSTVMADEKVATKSDIANLRNELTKIVENYEKRISQLELRLQEAEDTNDENAAIVENLAIEVSQQGNQQAANTFNPGIGVILNGHLLNTDSDAGFFIPGFALGEETGPAGEGFELGESEMNLSANVDDKFYASATLAFGEGVEVEEAYIQTIAVANGFNIKAGRFFSNIGYLASRHRHTDDFSDRPLAYEAFLGGQFGDDGVQLSWLAPTDSYWQSGFELYRGDSFPAAGAKDNGSGMWTFFTHIGDDINDSQSWRFGWSYLNAKVEDRLTTSNESFSGDSRLWIADFVWKWAPNGNSGVKNAIIQAEYLSRNEQGIFTDANSIGHLYDANQSGWYVQGLYQFMPQWRLGLRYSELIADNLSAAFAGTTLDTLGHYPKRTSLMMDWANSEFSRFRLQYSQDKSQTEIANLWILQYIVSFGAHGAHSF